MSAGERERCVHEHAASASRSRQRDGPYQADAASADDSGEHLAHPPSARHCGTYDC